MIFTINLSESEIDDLIQEFLKQKGYLVLTTNYLCSENHFYSVDAKVEPIEEGSNDQSRI